LFDEGLSKLKQDNPEYWMVLLNYNKEYIRTCQRVVAKNRKPYEAFKAEMDGKKLDEANKSKIDEMILKLDDACKAELLARL